MNIFLFLWKNNSVHPEKKERIFNMKKQENITEIRTIFDQIKWEVANELGVELGANATAIENGKVGGEITKRLIQMAKNQLINENKPFRL